MSQLGNIENIYGNNFNIATANTSGSNVLSATDLPATTLIIAAPQSALKKDTGEYSLFITDTDGQPVRLTYTIIPGNGLEANGDVLSLNIDNVTIKNKNGLTVNLSSIVNGTSVKVEDNKLFINTNALPIASDTAYGVFGTDNDTIKTVNNTLYVDTTELSFADENNFGIIKPDNEKIKANNGVLSVNEDALERASETTYGVCMPDNTTIISTNSVLSVVTSNLSKASGSVIGVVKVDGNTIISNNGVLSVNTSNLQKASATNFGTVKVDNKTIVIKDGKLTIPNHTDILNKVNAINNKLAELEKTGLTKTVTTASSTSTGSSKYVPTINKFESNHPMTAVLTPRFGKNAKEEHPQTVSCEIIVNTNTNFYLNVDLTNNINPAVAISQVILDDTQIYDATEALRKLYDSTNGTDKLIKIVFVCNNYNSTVSNHSTVTQATITASPSTNSANSKSVDFAIVRFNNSYKKVAINNVEYTKQSVAKDIGDKLIETYKTENLKLNVTQTASSIEYKRWT